MEYIQYFDKQIPYNIGNLVEIKTSTGGASAIGTTTIYPLSNYNSIMVTYHYGSNSGNLVVLLYPVSLLKTFSNTQNIGEAGNYHSVNFDVSYNSSSDTLTMIYTANSRAYSVCIYGLT